MRQRHPQPEVKAGGTKIDAGLGLEIVRERTPEQLHSKAVLPHSLHVDFNAAFGPGEDEVLAAVPRFLLPIDRDLSLIADQCSMLDGIGCELVDG
jgi:hypothetical protein